MSPGITRRGVN